MNSGGIQQTQLYIWGFDVNEKKYSPVGSIIKGATPLLIVIVSEALSAAADAGNVPIEKGVIYETVAGLYAAVMGFKNWIKNRKK